MCCKTQGVMKYGRQTHVTSTIGLEPGTVVITDAAVDGLLRPYMEIVCTLVI